MCVAQENRHLSRMQPRRLFGPFHPYDTIIDPPWPSEKITQSERTSSRYSMYCDCERNHAALVCKEGGVYAPSCCRAIQLPPSCGQQLCNNRVQSANRALRSTRTGSSSLPMSVFVTPCVRPGSGTVQPVGTWGGNRALSLTRSVDHSSCASVDHWPSGVTGTVSKTSQRMDAQIFAISDTKSVQSRKPAGLARTLKSPGAKSHPGDMIPAASATWYTKIRACTWGLGGTVVLLTTASD
jgi:hypothetical protein